MDIPLYQHRGESKMGFLDARFGAYLAVAALLIVTPGPDTALVTRNALLAGRRAASFTTLGIGAGSIIWAFASVVGIAALLEESVVAFTICKFVGAAYLGYLGMRSVITSFQKNKKAALTTPAPQPAQLRDWLAFRQGLLSNLFNPKAGAIFATALPQFLSPGDPPLRFERIGITGSRDLPAARTIVEIALKHLIIFDLDGVITSEEAYWDCGGLTLHELLYSPYYW